ncbi:hypothetical protein BU24DRAFT_404347 [Aaosphaeria arxii CBS 175.79]|uniref:Uncharacterized protein n=1 Tax=Aaosphaeria arxii CBS 175.79 TaxID=1450172 RepID=A0A6A5Y7Q7_9PLEO|nr:uncharacterized protein BU24DRAFT_404347 [Aaosphaeria arxii CBS 175.79]KAF2021329.1 hypothetical protein BU24DRAFT_404347 [Aaosphaeria arxii CBS 175.79]
MCRLHPLVKLNHTSQAINQSPESNKQSHAHSQPRENPNLSSPHHHHTFQIQKQKQKLKNSTSRFNINDNVRLHPPNPPHALPSQERAFRGRQQQQQPTPVLPTAEHVGEFARVAEHVELVFFVLFYVDELAEHAVQQGVGGWMVGGSRRDTERRIGEEHTIGVSASYG